MSRAIPGLAPATSGQEGALRPGRPAARFKPRRVWVVDPEQPFANKMVRALGRLGVTAECPGSPGDVQHRLHEHVPDLIIVALSQQSRLAQDLFRLFREGSQTGHVPFFFVVRGGPPLEIAPGVRLDSTCTLKKPFATREFLKGIAPLLRRLDRIQVLGRAASFSSTFTDVPLVDLIGLLQRYARSGLLRVDLGGRREPIRAWFQEGDLVAVEHPDGDQQEILSELLLLPSSRFEFRAGPVTAARSVDPEEWNESRELLFHTDRGQMNPFPYPLTVVRPEGAMPDPQV